MVQISKLTKNEIKETGFKNRSIGNNFMKEVLNKKARDFKKKEDLIKTFKKEYTKMMNFGIDLNENSRMDRKIKKIGKTNTKATGELENYLLKNMDDEVVLEMSIEDYLKRIGYKNVVDIMILLITLMGLLARLVGVLLLFPLLI
jgi:hypothetical protein